MESVITWSEYDLAIFSLIVLLLGLIWLPISYFFKPKCRVCDSRFGVQRLQTEGWECLWCGGVKSIGKDWSNAPWWEE